MMVESIYLYRLCKFLCGDESEVNSPMVEQKFFCDSASALALVRRTGTGRLKHVQIKQFFLQHLLRQNVFTVHKIVTKLNPADLNTKRLSGERRRLLGQMIGLHGAEDENNDNQMRQTRRVQLATRQQCIRLIQMAMTTTNLSLQLQGCMDGNNVERMHETTMIHVQMLDAISAAIQMCMWYGSMIFTFAVCFSLRLAPFSGVEWLFYSGLSKGMEG